MPSPQPLPQPVPVITWLWPDHPAGSPSGNPFMGSTISVDGIVDVPAAQQEGYHRAGNSSERAFALAASRDLDVVLPNPNQLFIDIDCDEDLRTFYTMLPILRQKFNVINSSVKPSRSGGERKHVTVTLGRDVLPWERILLQACLGSDRKRELLGYYLYLRDDPHPTMFFESREGRFPPNSNE